VQFQCSGVLVPRPCVTAYSRSGPEFTGFAKNIELARQSISKHDRVDKEAAKQSSCPMRHLWAENGPLDTFYEKDGGSPGIWRQWDPSQQGAAMHGGHFFPA
jgi:hypothetical protein